MNRRILLAVSILFAIAGPAWTQDTRVDGATIDWSRGMLTATLSRPVERAASADGIARAQRAIEREMPELMAELLAGVQFDSRGTIGRYLNERPELVSWIATVASQATAIRASSTPDLRTALVVFEVDLIGELLPGFVDHVRPQPLQEFLGWHPSQEYTGILIVADQELPEFASNTRAAPIPALFPGLYYATGTPPLIFRIAEREMFPPEILQTRGPVLYTDRLNDPAIAARVGFRPLRILARGVFGSDPTDLVISERDARAILSSPEMVAHLREARIAIVVRGESLIAPPVD